MFSSLFCNKTLLYTTDKEKPRQVFLSNDSFPHSSCNSCSSCGSNYLPSLQPEEDKDGKLLIALFSPLIGVFLKVLLRISVQRLCSKSVHPGYSYVLLTPLYCCSAVMFRVLQADLGSSQSIAVLGIIHGAAEVIERSTMVVIDHICHVLCKRTSGPWGSFRTRRRERLMADIAIMSMLHESSAIVSVIGFWYLYQFIYLKDDSLSELLLATVFCYHNVTSTGDRVVFHQRISSDRDSLSEYSCHGCLASRMEKTLSYSNYNFWCSSVMEYQIPFTNCTRLF